MWRVAGYILLWALTLFAVNITAEWEQERYPAGVSYYKVTTTYRFNCRGWSNWFVGQGVNSRTERGGTKW